jgi:hypothetical protein
MAFRAVGANGFLGAFIAGLDGSVQKIADNRTEGDFILRAADTRPGEAGCPLRLVHAVRANRGSCARQ